MNSDIIVAGIQNILIPEILAIVRAHRNATGNLPTDAEVLSALDIDADRVIAVGSAFLASKGAIAAPLPSVVNGG